ncbi:MAG: hypothetical protein HYZ65_04685 [Burkholderiales bacterium]|nr:hypothetical protein [Burkholderiales bacterium]
MANKALATRQRMTFRVEPSQAKPRNPVAVAAKQRAAGPHRKSATAIRQQQKIALKKIPPDDDNQG